MKGDVMAASALRWLEWLCLAAPLAVALGTALAWQSGAELDWRSEAGSVALTLPALALLWWAARARSLPDTARALTWAGWVLVGQALLSLLWGLLEPERPSVPAATLALVGGVGTVLALLPGLGLLALAAVLREVNILIQDDALTV
ncbi:hypothetical protein QOL99_08915 [Deinococcus sp. MIMF12]|uniref:DUF2975 domain-containing protein n=1 Tax=Deinococcus rhizophilus TaxID=3049544 RepID=A0ABT7JJZ9_9DEIO|nr:hypothetical protein [Deinococcus rhizophilus]MDL2344273.1 hypothetical protein [Deinococcus rhizophilus]